MDYEKDKDEVEEEKNLLFGSCATIFIVKHYKR